MGTWRRPARIVRSAGALTAGIVLVAGVPAALGLLAGNPLPSTLPSADELAEALTHGQVADGTLLKAVALVCWLAWVQLVAAMAVEVAEGLAGRRIRHAPPLPRVARTMAAALVGAVMSGTMASTAASTAALALPSLTANAVSTGSDAATDLGDGDGAVASALDAGTEEAEEADDADLVVQRGDTLWGLAGDHLGDPFAWPDLYETNRGRRQPDGRSLTDPDVIHPGWRLDLPTAGRHGATPGADPAAADSTASPDESASGDESPESTDDAVDAARRAEAMAAEAESDARRALERLATAGSIADEAPGGADPASLDDPLPEAGDGPHGAAQLRAGELHGAIAGRGTFPLPSPETWPGAARERDAEPEESPAGPGAAVDGMDLRPGSTAAELAGAGVLAGGIVWSLDRLRRRRERLRQAGEATTTPDAATAVAERSVRAAAGATVDLLDLVLRTFAGGLRQARRTPPPLVGVNVEEEVVSLLFASPDREPLPGFTAEDDGYSWVVTREAVTELVRSTPTDGPNPVPALVTVGHTDRSQVLLDPEALRLVSVTGPSLHAHETLATLALELATGPWSPAVRVVVVGFGHELAALPRVKVVEALDEAFPELEAAAAHSAAFASHHGFHSPAHARVAGAAAGALPATVVLCAGAVDPDAAERLRTLVASDVWAPAAIVAGDVEAEWRMEVAPDRVVLRPVGALLRRHRLSRDVRASLIRVLRPADDQRTDDRATGDGDAAGGGEPTRSASDSQQGDPPPPPPSSPAGRGRAAAALPGPVTEEDPALEVRLLGPVDVRGSAETFRRRKALELVAYLAVHPRGVDADTLSEALWPDRLVTPGTLHTMVSTARRCLGAGPAGDLYLPHVDRDGRYRLHPSASVDIERFHRLVARAAGADHDQAVADLRRALELVRGRPFTLVGGEYLWAHAEALVSAAAAEVADAAHDLATRCLEVEDPQGAWWATQRGLLASPANEQLYRDRMLAADRIGNPAGVEQVMEELCAAVEVDEAERDHVLHPRTLEVYQHLTRRRRARTLVGGA